MTVAAALFLLANAGFAEPQAHEIARYFSQATHGPGKVTAETQLNPCAASRYGEGLVDVTGQLRKQLHRDTGISGCVPGDAQIAWLAHAWPTLCPRMAAKFAAGDLTAFQRGWGYGSCR